MAAGGIARRSDYGKGAYNRRVRIIASDGCVSGELEDDFHHFKATLEHDGQHITRATGEAMRVPWSTCPGATLPLARLEGMALSHDLLAAGRHTTSREQCTHLFDAASLAIVFAAAGHTGQRLWEVNVPDRIHGATTATLRCDGAQLLQWKLERNRIVSPEPFSDRALVGGFGRWANEQLAPELAIAAQVLQRGIFIAMGRLYDFDTIDHATAHSDTMGSACHTFSPAHVERAMRVKGSVIDYTTRPHELLTIRRPTIAPDELEPSTSQTRTPSS